MYAIILIGVPLISLLDRDPKRNFVWLVLNVVCIALLVQLVLNRWGQI